MKLPADKNVSNAGVKAQYKKFLGRKILFIATLLAMIVILAGVSAALGSFDIGIADVYRIILDKFLNGARTASSVVVWEIRMPRIITAILAGVGLSVAGASMQAILKNPLGDPFTLGVSSGAGFGASMAILFGTGLMGGYFIIIGNAFLFSMVPALIIMALTFYKKATPETMILAGVAIMYMFSAATTLMMYFLSSSDAVKQAYFWMVGSLDSSAWDTILPMAIMVVLCMIPLLWKSNDMNLLASGDDTAKSLGINVDRLRVFIMAIASLAAASIVAFTGPIGFIGLVAPHICRIVIGGDNRFLIPASGLAGAALLLLADTVARTIMAPVLLPVGVVTDFIGAPLFIYLIIRRTKEYW